MGARQEVGSWHPPVDAGRGAGITGQPPDSHVSWVKASGALEKASSPPSARESLQPQTWAQIPLALGSSVSLSFLLCHMGVNGVILKIRWEKG